MRTYDCTGSLPIASRMLKCLLCYLPNYSYFLNSRPLLNILVFCPSLIMKPALWGRNIVWQWSAGNRREIGNLFSFTVLCCLFASPKYSFRDLGQHRSGSWILVDIKKWVEEPTYFCKFYTETVSFIQCFVFQSHQRFS